VQRRLNVYLFVVYVLVPYIQILWKGRSVQVFRVRKRSMSKLNSEILSWIINDLKPIIHLNNI
jgi:hypothetical protein